VRTPARSVARVDALDVRANDAQAPVARRLHEIHPERCALIQPQRRA
jgi:hypothetical protein